MARMLLIGVWLLLLDGIFLVPWWWPSVDPGDHLIRSTVRLSLLYYTLAALLMLRLRPGEWSAGGLARWSWSLAWLAFVIHLLFSMKYAHGWSHAHAMQHTQEVSGFGPGIYISHFFTLFWTLDVFWWWRWPADYAQRSPGIDWFLHAFMAFIIFCGTIVYEEGFIRWAATVMFVILGSAFVYRVARRRWRLGKGDYESLPG